jgi:hypothetical protein
MTIGAEFDLRRWQRGVAVTAILAAAGAAASGHMAAQTVGRPFALLLPAATITFPNETDSNSPALWELVNGQWTLALLNSVAGRAELSTGRSVARLADVGRVQFSSAAPYGGYWFEAVVRDTDAWYGYYHNEREDVVCVGSGKVLPRIGAARSEDHGRTWVDLGPILETPPGEEQCVTRNHYFVGGVGDFTALIDANRGYVYFYYSQYAERADRVGVAVARLAWADRDAPAGRVDVWNDGVWLPPSLDGPPVLDGAEASDDGNDGPGDASPDTWTFPLATPIFPAADRWDNAAVPVDVLWGPSIHWNAHLESYVMLLNRAVSNAWQQGGVFVSYNPRLDDPAGWTAPARLFSGGRWYPQVLGLDVGQGTDAYAGATARFFMGGRSDYTIIFGRR